MIIASRAFVSRAGPPDHYLLGVPIITSHRPEERWPLAGELCNGTSQLGSIASGRCAYLSEKAQSYMARNTKR